MAKQRGVSMSATAVQVNNKLPDGRQIRPLEGTYTQRQMFTLRESGLYVPAQEGIMLVKEHDQSIQSGAYTSVNVNNWWRTAEYGFYPKGFEKKAVPIGDKLVYVENGVSHALDIPDVPVKVNGENVSLRKAVGMGVIKLEKLQYRELDEKSGLVEVTSDFDPANDVKVVDIMRPRGWALVDADGYPLKSKPSNQNVSEARYSYVRHEGDFEQGSTGYHGSFARGLGDDDYYGRRVVIADRGWHFGSGVALVSGREAAAPRDVSVVRAISGSPTESVSTVRVTGAVIDAAEAEYAALSEHSRPEKLVAFRQLLDSLRIKE
jgi:hypothetical protein